MKKKANTLLVISISIFCVVLGYQFYQYMVQRNFMLYVSTACDPAEGVCFSPDTDASVDEAPYKKVELIAKFAPSCLSEHSCESFSCELISSEAQCQITYCSDESLEDGEECYVVLDNQDQEDE